MPTRVGVRAPKRQGAVSACTSGSDVNPVLMGGMYQSSPSSVANQDVAWLMTDSYGRLLVVPVLYDNTTEGTLLASGSRIATCATADQTNYNARGVIAWLDVTAVSGSETLTLQLEMKDPASGSYLDMLESASINAIGNYNYTTYPGAPTEEEELTEVVGFPLPRTWRVNVVHDSASPFTYSLGYCYLL